MVGYCVVEVYGCTHNKIKACNQMRNEVLDSQLKLNQCNRVPTTKLEQRKEGSAKAECNKCTAEWKANVVCHAYSLYLGTPQ